MTIKSFIFDLDGTLIDAYDAHEEAFRKAFKATGRTYEDGSLARYYGQMGVEIMRILLKKDAIDHECADLMRLKNQYFLEAPKSSTKILPCALELIHMLKERRMKIAIASSTSKDALNLAIEILGITDILDAKVSAADIKKSKPDPEIFLKAAKLLGTDPKECVVVEDSVHGVNAAKAAGMKSIAVATGMIPRTELETLNPDIIIDSLCDITKDIDGFLARI